MKDKSPQASPQNKKLTKNTIEHELRPLYDSLLQKNKEAITFQQLLDLLKEAGIRSDDERLKESLGAYLDEDKKNGQQELDFQDFTQLFKGKYKEFLEKAIFKQLSIPDFEAFCQDIEKYYKHSKSIKEGEVKNSGNPKHYAISVCTVDGQKFELGDHDVKFALQSVCKAINYPIALHERGEDKVHQHVGREPSGRGYNGLVLNQDELPHNPMINAGAIMVCSLIKPKQPVDKRLKHVEEIWTRLCGNTPVGFDQEVFKSEPMERNMALSYYMKEKGSFPEGTDINKNMEFYIKCCSVEVNSDQLAVAAATLANGGVCPTTGDSIFDPDNVRDCLSLMLSCGMYDYSGEFAFLVGLPAKSGVSGGLMVVVPGLMGIAIYSPPLDQLGNPVRGVEFCKELVSEYSLHKFDQVTYPANAKKDPRLPRLQEQHPKGQASR